MNLERCAELRLETEVQGEREREREVAYIHM
jgi:hypothetical protein